MCFYCNLKTCVCSARPTSGSCILYSAPPSLTPSPRSGNWILETGSQSQPHPRHPSSGFWKVETEPFGNCSPSERSNVRFWKLETAPSGRSFANVCIGSSTPFSSFGRCHKPPSCDSGNWKLRPRCTNGLSGWCSQPNNGTFQLEYQFPGSSFQKSPAQAMVTFSQFPSFQTPFPCNNPCMSLEFTGNWKLETGNWMALGDMIQYIWGIQSGVCSLSFHSVCSFLGGKQPPERSRGLSSFQYRSLAHTTFPSCF